MEPAEEAAAREAAAEEPDISGDLPILQPEEAAAEEALRLVTVDIMVRMAHLTIGEILVSLRILQGAMDIRADRALMDT